MQFPNFYNFADEPPERWEKRRFRPRAPELSGGRGRVCYIMLSVDPHVAFASFSDSFSLLFVNGFPAAFTLCLRWPQGRNPYAVGAKAYHEKEV